MVEQSASRGRVRRGYFRVLAAAGITMIVGCATMTDGERTTFGTVLGGVVGAVVGDRVGDSRLVTIAGGAAGALIGNRIANYLNERDEEMMADSTRRTVRTGEDSNWSNDESGNAGSSRVVGESRKEGSAEVPVRKDRVDQVPPLKLVGEEHVATTHVRIRGGPGTNYEILGSLNEGDASHVIGKVRGEPWYFTGENGVGDGFVHADFLQVASSEQVASTQTSSDGSSANAEVVEAPVEQECRTVEQTVILENGEERTDQVTACRTAEGWALADTSAA